MFTPGATRSGLASRSNRVGPRELESDTRSSFKFGRALRVERADANRRRRVARHADAAVARVARSPALMPLFPAAVTTATPLRDKRSTACTSGSVKIDSSTAWPSEMLTTLM